MDELDLMARKTAHELALTPVRISLPSFCCLRVCDNEATVLDYGDGTDRFTHRPGATLLLYAFCARHATLETP